MRVKKRAYLHPRTSLKPVTQREYLRTELRAALNKPTHQHTTQEYREWLIRQAIKKGEL